MGFAELQRVVGGWPSPGVVEITGRPGSGRCRLVQPLLGSTQVAEGIKRTIAKRTFLFSF